MQQLRVAAVVCCALWALGACGSCGSQSAGVTTTAPTQAELGAATVTGSWQLTVTVGPYSGPPPSATNRFQPGHRAVDRVTFVWQCASGGACTLQLWGPTGPDPSKESYYAFYSGATDLQGPPVSTPMTESGATYSQTIPIGGFGGYTCPPSRTVSRPEQRLSLTVTGATRATSGWTATTMTGAETFISGWGCGPGGFTGWTVGHLAISGKAG